MSFTEAVKSGFDNYVNFDGRARRSAYWYWTLFAILASIAANILDAVTDVPLFSLIVGLGLLLPGLAVSVRRLHDTNRTGWWILIGLIPIIGWIVLIVFYIQDSDPGENQYGPSPKGGVAASQPPPAAPAQ